MAPSDLQQQHRAFMSKAMANAPGHTQQEKMRHAANAWNRQKTRTGGTSIKRGKGLSPPSNAARGQKVAPTPTGAGFKTKQTRKRKGKGLSPPGTRRGGGNGTGPLPPGYPSRGGGSGTSGPLPPGYPRGGKTKSFMQLGKLGKEKRQTQGGRASKAARACTVAAKRNKK